MIGSTQTEDRQNARSDARKRTDDVRTLEDVDFSALTYHPQVLEGLRKSGFERPSPIQLRAIPLGRCGLDLIVQAKSGTGKTCVFTIVALESLDMSSKGPQVLVLAPTREIAVQIQQVVTSIGCAFSGLKCHVFIGGLPVNADKQKLSKCDIAVGTPGRIKQLIECQMMKTGSIRLLVLDEADKLLEQGFQEQINWIYSTLPESKQMIAASATYPEALAEHVMAYMHEPTMVRLNAADPSLLGIKQFKKVLRFRPSMHLAYGVKIEHLLAFLAQVSFHQCLIFSNLQTRAENLSQLLCGHGWPSTYISGSQDQQRRLSAMSDLRASQCRILVATDLISRGIDVDKVNLVINLDVPKDYDTYLHRIGRAGRFGSHGLALTYIASTEDQEAFSRLLVKARTPVLDLPENVPSDLVDRSAIAVSRDGAGDSTMPHTSAAIEVVETIELKRLVSDNRSKNPEQEATPELSSDGKAEESANMQGSHREPMAEEHWASGGHGRSAYVAPAPHGQVESKGRGAGGMAEAGTAAAASVWDVVATLRLCVADVEPVPGAQAQECSVSPMFGVHESGRAWSPAVCLGSDCQDQYDALCCAIENLLDLSRSAQQDSGRAGLSGRTSGRRDRTAVSIRTPSRKVHVARDAHNVRSRDKTLQQPDAHQQQSRMSPLAVDGFDSSDSALRTMLHDAQCIDMSLAGACEEPPMTGGFTGHSADRRSKPLTRRNEVPRAAATTATALLQSDELGQPPASAAVEATRADRCVQAALAAADAQQPAQPCPPGQSAIGSSCSISAAHDEDGVSTQTDSTMVNSAAMSKADAAGFPVLPNVVRCHYMRFLAADMYMQHMLLSLRGNKQP